MSRIRLPADYSNFGTASPVNSDGTPFQWQRGTASKSHGQRAKIVPDTQWAERLEREEDVAEGSVFVVVPGQFPNLLNHTGGRTRDRMKRPRQQREAVAACLFAHESKREGLAAGCVVLMTRISAGTLADEGLRASMKHVKDEVARWLIGGKIGERDEDSRLDWRYDQKSLGRGRHGVTISIRPKGLPTDH